MAVSDADERRQPVGLPDEHWSDSLYFNCWDRGTGIFLMTRMAALENQPSATAGLLAWRDGMPVLAYGHPLDHAPASDWDVTTIGGLTYRMQAACQEWVVQLDDGQGSAAHLTFTGTGPCADYRDCPEPFPDAWAAAHYEQVATVRGDLVIRGERVAFDGLGIRDHSWGLRRWSAFRTWDWVAFYADGIGGNVYTADIVGHSGGPIGFVTLGGETVLVAGAELHTEVDADRHPTTTELRVLLVDGRTVEVSGASAAMPLVVHPDPSGTAGVHEVPMTMTVDGRPGFGVHERLVGDFSSTVS